MRILTMLKYRVISKFVFDKVPKMCYKKNLNLNLIINYYFNLKRN